MQQPTKTFYIHTLGCRTNICESEQIKQNLLNYGCVESPNLQHATICIFNTCCVTQKAETKSFYWINKAINSTKCESIVVLGCASKLLKSKLDNPKIKLILDNKQKQKQNVDVWIEKLFEQSNTITKQQTNKYDSSIHTRAFLKIQDGCNMMCSYCIIPIVRGRETSIPRKEILNYITDVVNQGCKEIVLTGINTAAYNDKSYKLIDLIKDINLINGNFRIRFSSLEPYYITREIIDLITSNPKRWCQQLHTSLQSANDEVLKHMGRPYTFTQFYELCKYIYLKNPLFSITTDYIVGYPIETNQMFENGLRNLNKLNLAYLHIFPYSPRPYTKASKIQSIVSSEHMNERLQKIKVINNHLINSYLNKFKGKMIYVLFEHSKEKNIQKGHSEYYFEVKVNTTKNLHNQLLPVKVTKIENNQVFGLLKMSNKSY